MTRSRLRAWVLLGAAWCSSGCRSLQRVEQQRISAWRSLLLVLTIAVGVQAYVQAAGVSRLAATTAP